MRVYFIVFVLTFLAQFFQVKSDKQYWWRTVLSFIPLFLFMALRKDFGSDDDDYHMFYNGVHQASNIFAVNEHMEAGYAILNKIMPTYQSLIVLSSFLTSWAYVFLIYRYVPKRYSWLAVLLLFSAPSMTVFFMISGIRNGIAASLLVLSCYYIEKRKILPFIILTAVAMSIHTSALAIFTLCYLLGQNKLITKNQMWIWISVMVVLALASLASIVQNVLPVIDLFMDQYVGQVEGMAEIADERGFMGALTGIVFGVGLLLYLIQMEKYTKRSPELAQEMGSLKYKYGLLFAVSFTIGILGGRMGQYWIYFFIVSVVGMVAYWNNKVFKYGFLLLVLYFFRILYVSFVSNPDFLIYYKTYTSVLGSF